MFFAALKEAFTSHPKETWSNHLAAGTGTAFSLFNGAAILQSVLVGLIIYVITHTMTALIKIVKKRINDLSMWK